MRAAFSKARENVSDGLLERSITGTVEHYYRDGVLVSERRYYESWLGLAVLRRLDKQAQDDSDEGALAARIEDHWQDVVEGLRAGGTMAVTEVLSTKTDEADIVPGDWADEPDSDVWQTDAGVWMTTHAPPPDFDGYQNATFDGLNDYERECTAEEVELIEATDASAVADLIAEADARREWYFDGLREQARPPCSS